MTDPLHAKLDPARFPKKSIPLGTPLPWRENAQAMRTELDKIYTGDPTVSREGSAGAKSWKPSPSVPGARLVRDQQNYDGKHNDNPCQEYPMNFHGRQGTLCILLCGVSFRHVDLILVST